MLYSFSFAAPKIALEYYEGYGYSEKEYQHSNRVRERSLEHSPFSSNMAKHSKLKRKVSETEMTPRKNILLDLIYIGGDTTFYNRFSVIISA